MTEEQIVEVLSVLRQLVADVSEIRRRLDQQAGSHERLDMVRPNRPLPAPTRQPG